MIRTYRQTTDVILQLLKSTAKLSITTSLTAQPPSPLPIPRKYLGYQGPLCKLLGIRTYYPPKYSPVGKQPLMPPTQKGYDTQVGIYPSKFDVR